MWRIVIYVTIAFIVGAIGLGITHANHKIHTVTADERESDDVGVIMCSLFWPLTIPSLILMLILFGIYRLSAELYYNWIKKNAEY